MLVAALERNAAACGDRGEEIGALARSWHSVALETDDRALLHLAERLYRLHLATAPAGRDAAEMRKSRAELLWRLAELETAPDADLVAHRWEEAAVAFGDAADDKALAAEVRRDAAYASVLAWRYRVRDGRVGLEPVDDDGPPPIPDPEKRMIEAFHRFAVHLGPEDADDVVSMRFLEARIYFNFWHLDRAAPILRELVRDHPRHEVGSLAASLLLDTMIRLRRYGELAAEVDRMLADRDLLEGREDLSDRLRELHRGLAKREADALWRAEDYGACANAYLALYQRDRKARAGRDELLFNAAACAERAGETKHAADLIRRFLRAYPRSPLVLRARAQLDALERP